VRSSVNYQRLLENIIRISDENMGCDLWIDTSGWGGNIALVAIEDLDCSTPIPDRDRRKWMPYFNKDGPVRMSSFSL